MIFYHFTLMIVNYGKKADERCNYANIYYSRAHIRRMYGAFCVFLSSEIQGRRILHKTKKKPPSRNFVHDSGRMNISSVFVYIYISRRAPSTSLLPSSSGRASSPSRKASSSTASLRLNRSPHACPIWFASFFSGSRISFFTSSRQ